MIVLLLPQNTLIANAANNATVYEYSSMLDDRGNLYYIQMVEGDENSYNIYRLEVATGKQVADLQSPPNTTVGNVIKKNDLKNYGV